ncbi:unnamed protein product [Cladocopium goreaui]|uniref:Pentatricopeptide repeat-containing protein n=1 Tax=Cladocopium goreaui TaxID=2562237 RepID=A0A9P1DLL4_9DINO|nr:unnamed protein product [Cladocopium goreaui]
MQLNGVQPNVITLNSMLDACAKRGRLGPAEWWFHFMEDSNLEPNQVSFCALLNACAKAQNPKRAQVWFDKMLGYRIAADIVAYNAFIAACAGQANVAKAEELLTEARAEGIFKSIEGCQLEPTQVTYNAVISSKSQAGDVAAAVSWLDRMATWLEAWEIRLKPINTRRYFSTLMRMLWIVAYFD